jgi:hypothetical protein
MFNKIINYLNRKLLFFGENIIISESKIKRILSFLGVRSYYHFTYKRKDCLYIQSKKETLRLIVYCHGNGGNIYTRIKQNPNIEAMLELGNVIIYDPRGWGSSEDILPSFESLYDDLRDIYIYCKSFVEYDSITFYGESLGSIPVIQFCSQLEEQNFNIIIQSGIIKLSEVVSYLYPFLSKFSSIDVDLEENYKILTEKGIKGIVLSNPYDDIVPHSQSLKISKYLDLIEIRGIHSIGIVSIDHLKSISP